jgi:hypothetical protein
MKSTPETIWSSGVLPVKISGKMLEMRKNGDHATGFRIGQARGRILCLAQPNLCSNVGVAIPDGKYISEFLITGTLCVLCMPHQAGSPRSQFLSPCASIE